VSLTGYIVIVEPDDLIRELERWFREAGDRDVSKLP
jgi:hypothetical protein